MLRPYGILPAMVTPLDAQERVNEAALRRLVRHLLAGGVHGLFVLGSQGEFYAFTPDEKRRVLEVVLDEVDGRVPVYAHAAAIATRQAVALAQMMEETGADALALLTPFFVTPSQQELYDHYRAVAEATALPLILYDNPGRTHVRLAPETVGRLAELPNIVGIKDSGGDLGMTLAYIQATPDDFAVLTGPDALILAGLVYGTRGAVSAVANIAPHLAVAVYERFQAGDLEGARQAQARLAALRRAFRWGTYPGVTKEALNLLGIEVGPPCHPVGPLSEEARRRLASLLEEVGVLPTA